MSMPSFRRDGVLLDKHDLYLGQGLYEGFYCGRSATYFYKGDIYVYHHNTNNLIYTGPKNEIWLHIPMANVNNKWKQMLPDNFFFFETETAKAKAMFYYDMVSSVIDIYNELKDILPWEQIKPKLDAIYFEYDSKM